MKPLVAYFSCTGTTKRAALALAEAIGADVYEIVPKQPYTDADLNWTDKHSRSSVEMKDPDARPEISGKAEGMENYRTVFLGFPIWWYVAPRIVNTFLESYDFTGKTVIPFATSGGSGLGRTVEKLQKSCTSAVKWGKGKLLNGPLTKDGLLSWAKEYL